MRSTPSSRPLTTGAARVERMLLASVEAALPYSEQRALGNEVWSSVRSDDELRPLVESSYRAWLERVVGLIEEGKADGSDRRGGGRDARGVATPVDSGRTGLAPLPRPHHPRAGR